MPRAGPTCYGADIARSRGLGAGDERVSEWARENRWGVNEE